VIKYLALIQQSHESNKNRSGYRPWHLHKVRGRPNGRLKILANKKMMVLTKAEPHQRNPAQIHLCKKKSTSKESKTDMVQDATKPEDDVDDRNKPAEKAVKAPASRKKDQRKWEIKLRICLPPVILLCFRMIPLPFGQKKVQPLKQLAITMMEDCRFPHQP
jgi:hypothetical protein